MKIEYSDIGGYACYSSRFYAFTLSTAIPQIAYLGIESGGRTRRHMDYNLLKPGIAAHPSRWKNCPAKSFSVAQSKSGVRYSCNDRFKSGKTAILFEDEKTADILFESEKSFSGDFFEFAFGNDTAPATCWATPLDFDILSLSGTEKTIGGGGKVINRYSLPIIIHFPDYGMLKIESDSNDIACIEEFIKLKEMTGLCLGFKNKGHHNSMFAYHHGILSLKFHSLSAIKKVSLRLTIEKENYPVVKGLNFRDKKWDGLKRCWMNSFTLEKNSLTMGDNVALGGVAHLGMHFKSDLLLHTPQLSNGIKVQDFLRRGLMASFEKCISDSGEINWEYQHNPGKKQKMASFIDSTPSVIISFCNSFKYDRNIEFAKKYIDKAVRASKFLISLDEDDDGIIEVPFHGNFFDDVPGRNRNWWDNFAFGHKDIYFNLLCHRALKSLLQMLGELGIADSHPELPIFISKFKSKFDKTFYNPKTRVYAGWISRDGKMHDYMFTFASAMAINEMLVPQKKASEILKILLKKMRDAGFGEFKYGVPGPTMPVSTHDTIKWDLMGKWPVYENGGLCGQNAYHFIQALYNSGMRKEADMILFNMLRTFEDGPTHSGLMPGYTKSIDWRTKDGNPSGYNYLADNYYFMLAALDSRKDRHIRKKNIKK